jgi:HAMP domain-containing protein
MKSKLTDSIIFRLTFVSALMIIIGGVSIYHIITPTTQIELQKLVEKSQLSYAKYIADDIDRQIILRKKLISSLSSTIPKNILEDKKLLQNWLSKRKQAITLFSYGAIVVAIDGKEILAQSPILDGRNKIDYSKLDWFNEARSSSDVVISSAFMGKVSKQPMITISKAIKDKDGKAIAVVYGAAILNQRGFMDFIYKNRFGDSGGFLVVSAKDKMFVASNDKNMVLQPTPPIGKNLLHDRAMQGYRGTGVTENLYGTVELSAIASVESTDWFVVVRMPISEAYQPLYKLNEKMIKSMSFVIVAFVIIFISIMIYMLRPLKESADKISEMASGKAAFKKLKPQRADEIGEIVSGFNTLTDKVLDDIKAQQKLAQMGEMLSIIAHQWKHHYHL